MQKFDWFSDWCSDKRGYVYAEIGGVPHYFRVKEWTEPGRATGMIFGREIDDEGFDCYLDASDMICRISDAEFASARQNGWPKRDHGSTVPAS